MPNAVANTKKPLTIDITPHAPSPEQTHLLLPVVEEFLRALYVRHGEKKLTFHEKQSLFRNKQNSTRKGLFTLQKQLKQNPEVTLHDKINTYLVNQRVNRKGRFLQKERLTLLATTTEETLQELANLAADRAD